MCHVRNSCLAVLAGVALLAVAPARGDAEDPVAEQSDNTTPPTIEPAEPATDDGTSAAEQPRIAAPFMKDRAAAQESVASVRRTAAFQQTRAIDPPAGGGRILAFHTLADGGVVIATGQGERYGETRFAAQLAALLGVSQTPSAEPPPNQIIWLDSNGETRHTAPLPFACKGLTVAENGDVIAVGGDRVTVFSAAGAQVAEATAPHFTLPDDEQARLREEIAEQHREHMALRRKKYEQIVRAREDLEEVPADDLTPRQKDELARARIMERQYEATLTRGEASVARAVETGLAKARTIHRVAASREHLFLVANEPAGYGFGVWRCGRDFANPEKIIDGLRGCCGQMDVQVIGDELVIAENSRHRVAIYGFDGEPLRTFGQMNLTDVRKGFNGCCNPMNACVGPDGSLLLSESNGIVKQFTSDGTLIDILGAAQVEPGCKNSSIGLSTDGRRLYYLDIKNGRVLVLEKRS